MDIKFEDGMYSEEKLKVMKTLLTSSVHVAMNEFVEGLEQMGAA